MKSEKPTVSGNTPCDSEQCEDEFIYSSGLDFLMMAGYQVKAVGLAMIIFEKN